LYIFNPAFIVQLTPSKDNILFTLNEKFSTLTAQQIPPAPNGTALPLLANVSTIPPNTLNATFAAAEILISNNSEKFPNLLIYVSNRNLGPEFDERGDTIAILEFTNGSASHIEKRAHSWNFSSKPRLNLVTQVFTGLKQIRSMNIGPVETGADEFLIAGANVDGGVVMFRRVDRGRNLTEVVRNEEIANRTSFVFV